jgi:DNA polymerase
MFTYSVYCAPATFYGVNRGTGEKTYNFFKSTHDAIKEVLREVPKEEKVKRLTIFSNDFSAQQYSLSQIHAWFSSCRRCQLSNFRQCYVSHRGDEKGDVFFIGMCPGANEDATGFPFVGDSGDILNMLLGESKFDIPYIISNIVACFPSDGPKTRDRKEPKQEEIIACASRLWMQLNSVRPKIIIVLGQVALSMFYPRHKKMSINKVYDLGTIRLAAMRHPAFISRMMNDGDMFEYTTAIDFLKQLKNYIPKIKEGPWRISDGPFPFYLLNKELKGIIC